MFYRFTGQYTGGRTSITMFGVTFHGREPADVTDEDGIRRLSGHPEFEAIPKTIVLPAGVPTDLPDDEPAPYAPETAPKKRGRPRKG